MKRWSALQLVVLLTVIATLSGCTWMPQKHYQSASVVDYLYPDKNTPMVEPTIPTLKIPARVGIAFVPGSHREGLTEASKQVALKQVEEHFQKYQFVDDIQIIPTAYVRPKGGFANLDQLRRMFGIDLIALVSYDQDQFTDEGFASITYWTIVGAYVVRGEKNSTHTLMDTVVYDIASRSLLFRAPGISDIKSRSTPVNLTEQRREDSAKGYSLASANMIESLDAELTDFRQRVKERPEKIKVEYRSGYGGGSTGWLAVALFGIWAGRRIALRRRRLTADLKGLHL